MSETKRTMEVCKIEIQSLPEFLIREEIKSAEDLLDGLHQDLCSGKIGKAFLRDVVREWSVGGGGGGMEAGASVQGTMLAVSEHQIVGWMTWRLMGAKKEILELMLLCVSAKCARQGLSRKLMGEFMVLASDPSVRLVVTDDASGIEGFYQKLGFRQPNSDDKSILQDVLEREREHHAHGSHDWRAFWLLEGALSKDHLLYIPLKPTRAEMDMIVEWYVLKESLWDASVEDDVELSKQIRRRLTQLKQTLTQSIILPGGGITPPSPA